MAGSSFGNIFRVTTWGESHGYGIGAVVDGCPAGLELDEAYVQSFMDRRKPGTSEYTTQRAEGDAVRIMSGVFEGRTTGTPISLMIENTSQISKDYSDIAEVYRPGHADMCFDKKYGFRDYRGGGRSSGSNVFCHKPRLTVYQYRSDLSELLIGEYLYLILIHRTRPPQLSRPCRCRRTSDSCRCRYPPRQADRRGH